MDHDLARFADLDRRLVEVAKGIKILTTLAWPAHAIGPFLKGVRRGDPRLPEVEFQRPDNAEIREELQRLIEACDEQHPVGRFLARTARSYLLAATMLTEIGQASFTTRSLELYGGPADTVGPTRIPSRAAAESFLSLSEDLISASYIPDDAYVLTADHVAATLRARIDPVFVDHPIRVVLDPDMASKAAAGATRVRIRAATGFSDNDLGQLLEHEIFVHSATALNGRQQPYITSLGLGAPRTTTTQEGLATFAEMITNTMDLARLRRLALRVIAIDMALDGADFIEVFRYFHDQGQNLYESFHSTARIFRGGDVRGGVVFTKDSVYLQGLLQVHAFLLKAIESRRPELLHHLFAGRLTLADTLELSPWFDSGALRDPLYEPPWVDNRAALAAFLMYSAFNTRFDLRSFELTDFSQE